MGDCSICLEKLDKNIKLSLSCGHNFHQACINEWLLQRNITCPLCRKPQGIFDLIKGNMVYESSKYERKDKFCVGMAETLNKTLESPEIKLLLSNSAQNSDLYSRIMQDILANVIDNVVKENQEKEQERQKQLKRDKRKERKKQKKIWKHMS